MTNIFWFSMTAKQSTSLPHRELWKQQVNYEKQSKVSISCFYSIPYMVPRKGPITQVLYAGYINALIGWPSYLKDSNFTVG